MSAAMLSFLAFYHLYSVNRNIVASQRRRRRFFYHKASLQPTHDFRYDDRAEPEPRDKHKWPLPLRKRPNLRLCYRFSPEEETAVTLNLQGGRNSLHRTYR